MTVERDNSQSGAKVPSKFTRPLRAIALFGGANEISKSAARFISRHDPDVALRLLVRRTEARAELQELFPDADIRMADYFDRDSLVAGLDGIDAAFVITPDFFDETTAMTNVVHAARTADIQHIVRMTGDPPGMSLDRVPDFIKRAGNVPSIQHLYARAVLEASGLPVTFLNSAAYYMQTMATPLFADPVKKDQVLVMPCDKTMTFIDKADIGECVATLLLSDDHRHIGASYHLNNGHDLLCFKEFAALLSDVLGRHIDFDESEGRFLSYHAEPLKALLNIPDAGKLILEMFKFETAHEHAWRRSDIVEHLLGRPARTLRDWLEDNKHKFEAM
ncbi:MAG TPA: NmrA family NAD(P)-binding protein [Sphingobium sp.]|nr:NmrA family NAD(P)-binding protein [Sphingobium sp.]